MENASKALLMAAGALLGVMILALGAFLLNMMITYTSQTQDKMDAQILAAFNQQFLKYSTSTEITAHDIVGIANLARTNNEKYDVEDRIGTYYVNVRVTGITGVSGIQFNAMEKEPEEGLVTFIKKCALNPDNSVKYYRCRRVTVDDHTGRVNDIIFEPIT